MVPLPFPCVDIGLVRRQNQRGKRRSSHPDITPGGAAAEGAKRGILLPITI